MIFEQSTAHETAAWCPEPTAKNKAHPLDSVWTVDNPICLSLYPVGEHTPHTLPRQQPDPLLPTIVHMQLPHDAFYYPDSLRNATH